jgi:hypothetical protein
MTEKRKFYVLLGLLILSIALLVFLNTTYSTTLNVSN